MKITRLYLIRHGQVVGHETPRFNGHTDVDLTPLGRIQLEAAAEDLAGVELAAVYCSDLKRASYGGEILAQAQGLDLRIEPDFREIAFGQWEGLTFDQVQSLYPGELERRRQNHVDYRIPGGETVRELWDRVGRKIRAVLDEHQGRAVAVVTHSGVNRAALLQAIGCEPAKIWRIDQSFGCLNIIDYFDDGVVLVRLANGPNRIQGE